MVKNSQNIITNKNNNVFYEKDIDVYLKTNNFIQNKKLISISPGGIKGFYLMGVLNFIKQNYDLSEYIFSGASAGAWNSLFMCFNKNPNDFVYKMLNSDLKKTKTMNELEYLIKYKILKSYSEDDFNLERLFIGVTTIQNKRFQTSIFFKSE
jgi:predicted acylesterase/phospholipase RssA